MASEDEFLDSTTRPALSEPNFPPDPTPGQFHQQGDDLYKYVNVHYGKTGGRWAYWHSSGVYSTIIDTLFSPGPLMAGFLPMSWNGLDRQLWIKVHGWTTPPTEPRESIEPIERREGRYERNDVDRISQQPKSEGKDSI